MGKQEIKGTFTLLFGICVLALSGATAAAHWAGNYHPTESTIMPLLGNSLPVLIVVCLLATILFLLLRKPFWALLPLVAIGINWNYLTAIIQFNSQQEWPVQAEEPLPYLTVATYNVHNFGNEVTGYSCKQIAQRMAAEQVDVLCFQEFLGNHNFPLDSIRTALSHWEYQLFTDQLPQGEEVLPMAVFSRYPLSGAQLICYPDSHNSSLKCDVLMATGDTIRLFCNHLQTTSISQKRSDWERELSTDDTRREAQALKNAAETLHTNLIKRAYQADSLYQLTSASPYPVVLCGDLNSLPSSYTYHRLTNLLTDGFKDCGRGYMRTYRQGKGLARIDYILYSPQLAGVRYTSPSWNLCSDHNPVLATVRVK